MNPSTGPMRAKILAFGVRADRDTCTEGTLYGFLPKIGLPKSSVSSEMYLLFS
jgi:hypothetical protein